MGRKRIHDLMGKLAETTTTPTTLEEQFTAETYHRKVQREHKGGKARLAALLADLEATTQL